MHDPQRARFEARGARGEWNPSFGWRNGSALVLSKVMTWLAVMMDALSEYPRWFVVTCVVLAGSGLLWFSFKVMKFSLCMLAVVAVLGLAVLAVGLWMG